MLNISKYIRFFRTNKSIIIIYNKVATY